MKTLVNIYQFMAVCLILGIGVMMWQGWMIFATSLINYVMRFLNS